MFEDNTKEKIPTVRGFAVGKKFYFECSFCQKFHSHGVPSVGTGKGKLNHGHRISHCDKNSPYKDTGYFLKEYTKSELKRIKEWVDERLSN